MLGKAGSKFELNLERNGEETEEKLENLSRENREFQIEFLHTIIRKIKTRTRPQTPRLSPGPSLLRLAPPQAPSASPTCFDSPLTTCAYNGAKVPPAIAVLGPYISILIHNHRHPPPPSPSSPYPASPSPVSTNLATLSQLSTPSTQPRLAGRIINTLFAHFDRRETCTR